MSSRYKHFDFLLIGKRFFIGHDYERIENAFVNFFFTQFKCVIAFMDVYYEINYNKLNKLKYV